jgi:hypothetical protein
MFIWGIDAQLYTSFSDSLESAVRLVVLNRRFSSFLMLFPFVRFVLRTAAGNDLVNLSFSGFYYFGISAKYIRDKAKGILGFLKGNRNSYASSLTYAHPVIPSLSDS